MEVKGRATSYRDVPTPTYDAPESERAKIADVSKLGLYVDCETDPYLTLRVRRACCFVLTDPYFWTVRGSMYVVAFVWALLTGVWAAVGQLLCCRATYRVPSDEEFTDIFMHRIPYCSLVRELAPSHQSDEFHLQRESNARTCRPSKLCEPEQLDLLPREGTIAGSALTELEHEVSERRVRSPSHDGGCCEVKCRAAHAAASSPERAAEQARRWQLDTRIMAKLKGKTFGDAYRPEGLLVTWREDARGKRALESISNGEHTARPGDGGPWELGKLLAMTGAHYRIKFETHPNLHFPLDALAAITRRHFSPDSVLRQLLEPHLRFTQTVNRIVSQGRDSVMYSQKSKCVGKCWAAQAVDKPTIQGFLREGYTTWPPLLGRSPYTALQPWYDHIRGFVRIVTDEYLRFEHEGARAQFDAWAADLQHYLGFPALTAALDGAGCLTDVLADTVFRASVQHSAEHHGMHTLGSLVQPMATKLTWDPRAELPSAGAWAAFALVGPLEYWRQNMYHHMFVAWWNQALLHNSCISQVQYSFECEHLQAAAARFRSGMLSVASPTPLDRIAQSIEW